MRPRDEVGTVGSSSTSSRKIGLHSLVALKTDRLGAAGKYQEPRRNSTDYSSQQLR